MTSSPPAHEDPEARAEISSTSSSEYLSPTIPGTSELLRAICVEVVENQRWFPILGWATSRLGDDPPNFTIPLRVFSTHHTPAQQAFARAMVEANPNFFRTLLGSSQTAADHNTVPQEPLSYRLPQGYEWDDDWFVTVDNPRGCDPAGWRYAARFDQPGDEDRVHFKKTWGHECVVRRRVWRRYAHLAGPLSASSPASPLHDTESRLYLREKQDEMSLAEKLKQKRAHILAEGGIWSTEDDLAAEDELRSFVRARRGEYSTSNRLSKNPSFANPFEQAVSSGSAEYTRAGARSVPMSSLSPHQASQPPDAAASTSVTDFRHYEPSDSNVPREQESALAPQPSVTSFLPSTSPVVAPDHQPAYPIDVNSQSTDFDAIFSKFVNNPEIGH